MKLFRLICQGCNRYSRACSSLAGSFRVAREDGWTTSIWKGSPSSPAWCRRCSSLMAGSLETG